MNTDRNLVLLARTKTHCRADTIASSRSAFSLVEILIVIAALGVLASVAVVSLTGAPDEARKAKLEQDVAVVNNAIDTYLAAGGDAAQLTEDNVVSALKQRVAPAPGPGEIVGPQGPFLDTRVITKPTDFAWSALYTTDPQPRFYVVQSRDGVVFDLGQAMAVGGAAERLDAARGKWVWDYTTATAPGQAPTFVPTAIDSGYTSTNVPLAAVTLDAPVFSPGSTAANLWEYPLSVSIDNPNPSGSSRIYYKAGAGGNYVLYDNTPFNVDPGTTLYALAVSLDPSRYYNSAPTSAEYTVIPLQLAVSIDAPGSITYAQAGGLITGQAQLSPASATINLDNTNIPATYLRSANFTVQYTTDGSDPLSSGTAVVGPEFTGYYSPQSAPLALTNWGTNTSLTVRAAAKAVNTSWFISSPVDEATVTIAPTVLDTPSISPAGGAYVPSIAVTVSNVSANMPVGAVGYYTTNGSTPAAGSGTSFSTVANFTVGPLAYGATATVKAVTCGPTNYSQWFTTSSVNSVTYTGPNYSAGSSGGVLISGGSFANNAVIRGSVIVASAASGTQPNLTLANGGSVTGNVYLPGTPTVTGVATNRVINLDGPTTPTNYTFAVGNNATIGGSVYRRITPTPLPTVTNPTGLVTRSNQSSGTLLPGSYNTVAPNNGATITLGIAGSTNPAVYSITNFSVNNNARVNIVGPVILTLNPGSSKTISIANNVVIGNSAHPEWLQFNMYSGNLNLGNNGTLYAAVKAPTSTVTFENNSIFRGSVTAKTFNLENNGEGIVFTLAPPE